jgi:hypothetical protein
MFFLLSTVVITSVVSFATCFIRPPKMKAMAFPILLCIGCLLPMHLVLEPWFPAWLAILFSLLLASLIFVLCVHWASRKKKLPALLYGLAIAFCLVLPWRLFWSAGEVALVPYHVKQFGKSESDEMDRYFYPGNSGRGFADGFNNPKQTFLQFALLAAAIAGISLVPHKLWWSKE